MRHFSLCLALSLLVVCSGCRTDHLRWKTEVDVDGKITRTVHLPAKKVPSDCPNPTLWDRSGYTDASPEKSQELNIDELKLSSEPKNQDDKEFAYFTARGTFNSVDEIPTHYRVQVDENPAASSEIQPRLQINDYLVLKEYVWRETLTETVELKDVPRVRRELVEMIVSITRNVLDKGLDDVYDASALLEWMETDGDRWLEEAYGVYLSAALKQIKPEELPAEFGAVCQRYGLTEMSNEEVRKFIQNLLKEKLRRTDGKPVEQEVITSIVTISGLSLKEEGESDSSLDKVLEQVILDTYQTRKQAEAVLYRLISKLVGVHGIPFLLAPEQYQVSLKMPGRIVETDAALLADGGLRWTFKDEQITPFGFEMSCRSIVTDPESQKQVLKRTTPMTSTKIDRVLELLGLDDELAQVMINCGKQQSIDPLKTYREQFYEKTEQGEVPKGDANEDERRSRADELWQLLTASGDRNGAPISSSFLPGGKTLFAFGILFAFILLSSLVAFTGKRTPQTTTRQT